MLFILAYAKTVHNVLNISILLHTDIKNKTKFFSYIRKFRWDRLQSHIYRRQGFLIFEEMRKNLTILYVYEEAVAR